MEKTKQTCVYLEEVHINYLKIESIRTGLSMSQLLRDMVDNDMLANETTVKNYETIIYR